MYNDGASSSSLKSSSFAASHSVSGNDSMFPVPQFMFPLIGGCDDVMNWDKKKPQKHKNLANRQKPGCGQGTGVDRSRTATTLALKKKFKEKVIGFQSLRESIHQEYREVLDTLAEIQERHDAVIEVERKILDLQQIFS
ncbi:hypothetical protein L1887_27828 [Cichorium endivia]|nr:hypothetical protein L1887_27828 [Cichorium endivia]